MLFTHWLHGEGPLGGVTTLEDGHQEESQPQSTGFSWVQSIEEKIITKRSHFYVYTSCYYYYLNDERDNPPRKLYIN